MKEARIIAPFAGGHSANNILARELVQAFGGLTRTQGTGFWINPTSEVTEEQVWVYDVACPDNTETRRTLLDLAIWYKGAAKQTCVYLRLPDGIVRFV